MDRLFAKQTSKNVSQWRHIQTKNKKNHTCRVSLVSTSLRTALLPIFLQNRSKYSSWHLGVGLRQNLMWSKLTFVLAATIGEFAKEERMGYVRHIPHPILSSFCIYQVYTYVKRCSFFLLSGGGGCLFVIYGQTCRQIDPKAPFKMI